MGGNTGSIDKYRNRKKCMCTQITVYVFVVVRTMFSFSSESSIIVFMQRMAMLKKQAMKKISKCVRAQSKSYVEILLMLVLSSCCCCYYCRIRLCYYFETIVTWLLSQLSYIIILCRFKRKKLNKKIVMVHTKAHICVFGSSFDSIISSSIAVCCIFCCFFFFDE